MTKELKRYEQHRKLRKAVKASIQEQLRLWIEYAQTSEGKITFALLAGSVIVQKVTSIKAVNWLVDRGIDKEDAGKFVAKVMMAAAFAKALESQSHAARDRRETLKHFSAKVEEELANLRYQRAMQFLHKAEKEGKA